MTERMVQIPVNRIVRDRLKEMKKEESYSEYLIKLTKLTEGCSLESQPSDESPPGDSSNVT